MRILLTNHALDARAGTEIYVRDVALALLARGHEPIVYSRRLGEVARELRAATVPVLDDLEALHEAPDLIHAQHHLETMTVLARFPDTPAVYVCHGWLPSEESPPAHPRIVRYVAVDKLVRQRLIDECGIDHGRVEVHLNWVDTSRFKRRKALGETPSRALVFSNYVDESNCLPALREACQQRGLELDVIGASYGRGVSAPEDCLGDYDIVFAKGRAALEAAVVGAAVILCDRSGLGPLVSSDQLDHVRAFNFGVRLLREPVTSEAVLKRIKAYDGGDAAIVAERLRHEASLEAGVDRLIQLYEEALEEAAGLTFDPQADLRAMARYLRGGPLSAGDFHQCEREALLAEAARAQGRTSELHHALARAEDERSRVEIRLAETSGYRDQLRAQEAELHRVLLAESEARLQLAAMAAERQRVELELGGTLAVLTTERQLVETELRRHVSAVEADRDQVRETASRLQQRLLDVEAERQKLEAEFLKLDSEHSKLLSERQELESEHSKLSVERRRVETWASELTVTLAAETAARLTAEDAVEALGQRAGKLIDQYDQSESELLWIKRSATWRLRQWMVSQKWLVALFGLGKGAKGAAGDSGD